MLRVEDLKKHYSIRTGIFSRVKGWVHAVDGISFSIDEGQIFGLVGESGCGKTTTGRLILRLVEPTSGTVHFMGENVFESSGDELRNLRRKMQIIFQDPYASLNPRKRIGQILGQPLLVHRVMDRKGVSLEVQELLRVVGLTPVQKFVDRYPHELSGGQRQRVAVARAIALRPKLVVADEPVTALDISIRAQIINLLKDLRERYGLTYLYITHELAMVRSIADKVAVMYLGKIVEMGGVEELFEHPLHPYTAGLLASTPIPNPRRTRGRKRTRLAGEPPSPIDPPPGCRFHTRCPLAKEVCRVTEPELTKREERHWVACHLIG